MNDYRPDVEPLEVELVMQEVGSTGDAEVMARFMVPVLLCHDETDDRGWKVDLEAMEEDLMQQLRSWALALPSAKGKRAV